MFVTLKAKRRQGQEVVATHGSIWLVRSEAEKVAFSRRAGPWLLIESPHDMRWVHGTSDEDFLVEAYGSDLDAQRAEALRRELTRIDHSQSLSETRGSAAPTRTRRKNPFVAAVLSFVFGPLGWLYIGWRYAVLALAVVAVFVLVLTAINFPIPSWMKYVILLVFAWKAFTIVSVRNALIDAEGQDVLALNTFPIAAMAMSDLLVGIGMFYAGAIGLYVAGRLVLEGSVLRGLLVVLIGTPVLVLVAGLVFLPIAMGIDFIFAPKMKNIFRK